MAKAWIATRWGDLDGWEFVEQEVRPPAHGEVTIRVEASGVNPADRKHVISPRPGRELPVPIGYEVAGTLSAVGPGTEIASGGGAVGDAVLAFRVAGGYATELTVPASDVFAKPESLGFAEAANLLLVGSTASQMLHVVGVGAGDTILVNGASGAVGVSILQQARDLGARVDRHRERVALRRGAPLRRRADRLRTRPPRSRSGCRARRLCGGSGCGGHRRSDRHLPGRGRRPRPHRDHRRRWARCCRRLPRCERRSAGEHRVPQRRSRGAHPPGGQR